eukprot:366094-Chlamydomonas_euryale.AAC.10
MLIDGPAAAAGTAATRRLARPKPRFTRDAVSGMRCRQLWAARPRRRAARRGRPKQGIRRIKRAANL